MILVDMWKRLAHTNLVQLREVFTTKAFGDHCQYFFFILFFFIFSVFFFIKLKIAAMVFVYDYHPGSETLLTKHFSATELNGFADPFATEANSSRSFTHSKGNILRQQHNNLLPESVIWSYIIQLTAALRVIHAAGEISNLKR